MLAGLVGDEHACMQHIVSPRPLARDASHYRMRTQHQLLPAKAEWKPGQSAHAESRGLSLTATDTDQLACSSGGACVVIPAAIYRSAQGPRPESAPRSAF